MQIQVNGKIQEIKINNNKTIVLNELLLLNKVQNPDTVSVQLNGELVENEDFDKIFVKDKDEVEFLYFMGGGIILGGL